MLGIRRARPADRVDHQAANALPGLLSGPDLHAPDLGTLAEQIVR